MNKIHVLVASLILGLAAIFGVAATTKTAGLGAAAKAGKVSDATIAARQRKLNRAEIALRKARADRPPALPSVPRSSGARTRAQRVVYARPAPVVVVRSGSHGEHEDEHEEQHEGEDD